MMNASVSSSTSPRLTPIDRPDSWYMRLVYAVLRWTMGHVLTPVKVIGARVPGYVDIARKMNATEAALSLSADLRFLVKRYVATLNGCSFCMDVADARAHEQNVPADVRETLMRYQRGDDVAPPLQAVLTYVEEATQTVTVSDATFDALRDHFRDRAIAEITWLTAMENYYNRVTRPLNIGSDGLCPVDVRTAKKASVYAE